MNTHKTLAILLSCVVLAVLIGTGFFLMRRNQPAQPQEPQPNTPSAVQAELMQDPAYAAAETQFEAGNTSTAYTLFTQALQSATSSLERSQIQYNQALSLVGSGNYLEAIPILQSVADNGSYDSTLRAYALEQVVSLYEAYNDPRITSSFFNKDPYRALFQSASSTALAYRSVALYSETLQPIAPAAVDVALFNAIQLRQLSAEASSSAVAARIQLGETQMHDQLAIAQSDLPRIMSDPIWAVGIPLLYTREAETAEILEALHITSMPLADAATLYEKAIAAAKAPPGNYSFYKLTMLDFASYRYALYLAEKSGASAAPQIQSLLANLYAPSSSFMGAYFKSPAAMDKVKYPQTHAQIALLASIDPKFKAYLTSLGWR